MVSGRNHSLNQKRNVVMAAYTSAALEVQDDFELIGWDFVSNPSTHGAFMYPDGMHEGINEGLITEGIDMSTISKIDPKIQRIHNNITNIICEIGNVCECIIGDR